MRTLSCILLILVATNSVISLDSASGGQQTKLEDIERDNLISERRTKGEQLQYKAQAVRTQSKYQHETRETEQGGVTYARPSEQEIQYEQQAGVQYATAEPESFVQQKEFVQQQQVSYTPVHEADRTYSAPSRHSLASPTVPTAPVAHYVTAQPQYVYVQAGPPQQQHHYQMQQQQLVYQPQEQQYIQYVQYVPQTQQYQHLMQQHHQPEAQAFVMVPYSQGQEIAYQTALAAQQYQPAVEAFQAHSHVPQRTIGSTAGPLQAGPRYTSTSKVAGIQYAPQTNNHNQELVQHVTTQQQYLQQPQTVLPYSLAPVYDFYNYHHRHPTSLLDSYIPSSVLLARQQKNVHTPVHDSNIAYNTIAYSTPHSHLHQSHSYNHQKRSSTK